MANGMEAFDRFMDGLDSMVDTVAGKKSAPAPHASARPAQRPSSSTAIAANVNPIMEAIDAETGTTIFIVKMGNDSAECRSRAFAERIRRLLMEHP